MPKGYISNRQQNLKIGISSYTESQTVLEVTGKVGIGTTNATSELDVNGDVNISGIATVNVLDANQVSRLSPDGSDYGTNSYVPISDGSGGWSWQPVTSAGAGVLDGITIRDEGGVVGTAGSITDIDFRGNNLTAISVSGGAIATVTASDTPTFDTLNVTGVSTFQGNVYLGDNDKINLGDNNDLQIYHDGSASWIWEQGPADLYIRSNGGSINLRLNSTDMVVVRENQFVALNYGSSRKFETTGAGVTVFGTTETQQLSVSGITTSALLNVGVGGTIITTTNGNIGIGSTNPTSKLTVVGDVNVSGVITATNIAEYYFQPTAPSSPYEGDHWIDSTDGTCYIYYDDGDTQQWVEFGPTPQEYLAEGVNIYNNSSYVGFASAIDFGSNIIVTPLSVGIVTVTSSIGISTAGGIVGTGVTLLDFRGAGISTVTVSSGIGTINIEGGASTPDISPVMMGMIF